MEDGHRSWRWTATRYEVACVRLLDRRDIRASVWVISTKSNAKIAIGWAELASSVTTQMLNMRLFRARLKKRRLDGKCATKSTYAGTYAEAHIAKIKQAKSSYSAFSSFLFTSQNIIQYRNTNRNCKLIALAMEPRKKQRAYEAWAPQSRRKMYDEFRWAIR